MRVTLFGLPVDILSHDETVERILMEMASGRRCQHVAINVAKLINARTNAELENDIRASDIVGIDGARAEAFPVGCDARRAVCRQA
jgi:N-acetylglucosaminyldiphosphoundecaprenol N-acetyl-beta-D-mannosaminyltransferase